MKEYHAKSPDDFYTVESHWDCECEFDYIHDKKIGNYCPICGMYEEEQPDARANEVAEYYDKSKDSAIKK